MSPSFSFSVSVSYHHAWQWQVHNEALPTDIEDLHLSASLGVDEMTAPYHLRKKTKEFLPQPPRQQHVHAGHGASTDVPWQVDGGTELQESYWQATAQRATSQEKAHIPLKPGRDQGRNQHSQEHRKGHKTDWSTSQGGHKLLHTRHGAYHELLERYIKTKGSDDVWHRKIKWRSSIAH